jgi:hypothetical protein
VESKVVPKVTKKEKVILLILMREKKGLKFPRLGGIVEKRMSIQTQIVELKCFIMLTANLC